MSWTEQPIHFVDFEGNRSSGILEYGVATVVRGEVVEVRTRLCGALGRVLLTDTAVHGLSAQDVAAAAPLSADWEYFAGLRETGPLAAHYAGVENSLLKSVWPYPRESPDFARAGGRVADWGPWIDTARLYAQFFPTLSSGRLETLLGEMQLQAHLDALANRYCPSQRCHYHAALYDALAGAVLLCALARDPELAQLTTMQVLALSTLDADKRDDLQQGKLF